MMAQAGSEEHNPYLRTAFLEVVKNLKRLPKEPKE